MSKCIIESFLMETLLLFSVLIEANTLQHQHPGTLQLKYVLK